MAKRKAKRDATVCYSITFPAKLAKRLDGMLHDLRAEKPYQFVSRSAFYSYCLGEWLAILDDPAREPKGPKEVRRRIRKTEDTTRANGNARLTAAKVRAIRKDKRVLREIAGDLGVAATTIGRIKSGATWGWVQ